MGMAEAPHYGHTSGTTHGLKRGPVQLRRFEVSEVLKHLTATEHLWQFIKGG